MKPEDAFYCYDPELIQSRPGRVRVAVKDIIATKDFPTTMGSPVWTRTEMGFDARCVAMAREYPKRSPVKEVVIVGKTRCAEFGVHYQHDPPPNPRFPGRTAGTSSAGSALAVLGDFADIALATQTAGSIIRPAAYTGTWAMKPTFGLIPRTGVLKTTEIWDTVGFFVNTPENLELALRMFCLQSPNYLASYKLREVRCQDMELSRWSLSTLLSMSSRAFARIEDFHTLHRKWYDYQLYQYLRPQVLRQEQGHGELSPHLSQLFSSPRPELSKWGFDTRELESLLPDRFLRGEMVLYDFIEMPPPVNEEERPLDWLPLFTMLGYPIVHIPVANEYHSVYIVGPKYSDFVLLEGLLSLLEALMGMSDGKLIKEESW